MANNALTIIPEPRSVEFAAGTFLLSPDTAIEADPANEGNQQFLQSVLNLSEGQGANVIRLRLDQELNEFGPEGYTLVVSPELVTISAIADQGVFYGIQSLCQLLPAGETSGSIPCMTITDSPRFSWRGFMLDEGRNFQGKEMVLRLLDAMALMKLNIFHWHLTEDQGWRLEIEQYPRLTQIGSRREGTGRGGRLSKYKGHDGVPHEGFYSQAEIREVVEYAAARHITVVPEIEMPGHALAALAAYPEFSCTGGPFSVSPTFGIFEDIYCPGKEETFVFLQNILDEVMALFPGPYIHSGGDETPHSRWRSCADCQQRIVEEGLGDENGLQPYLTNRIAGFLAQHGRTMVGWNEILNDSLRPTAIAQYWFRNRHGVLAAIENGRRTIMSPNWYYYLDYSYGVTPLSKSYNHEPVFAELSEDAARNVLGVEAPLWTEFVPTPERLGYQVFPRLAALAEVAWTMADRKDFSRFRQRLPELLKRLQLIGLTSAPLDKTESSALTQKLAMLNFLRP